MIPKSKLNNQQSINYGTELSDVGITGIGMKTKYLPLGFDFNLEETEYGNYIMTFV